MRIATFAREGGEHRVGVVEDDVVVDLAVADPTLPRTTVELIERGDEVRDRLRAAVDGGQGRVPLIDVTLLAPVPDPPAFFGVGLNYRDHALEGGRTSLPEVPTLFTKASSCVVGPHADIELPSVSDQLDYEGELGFVIGRRCRHVSRADAADVIAGYMVVNDVSVRDWQRATTQWTLGKSFDTHGPTGPWLVTPDEVGDPHDLDIRTYVNGHLRQESNTRQLIHDCYALVEYLSTARTLQPGDIVCTGTPAGVGAWMKPETWLRAGDVVRVEIERLGTIENHVVAAPVAADQEVS